MAERGNRALRLVDRTVGVFLVLCLSVLARHRSLPSRPNRIGVLCLGAIGDFLLLSAAVRDLQRSIDGCDVVIIGSADNRAAAALVPDIPFVAIPATNPIRAARVVRRLGFDLIIDSSQWARLPAVICAVSGAPSVGFRTAGQGRHFAYAACVDHSRLHHELDNFRNLMSGFAQPTDRVPTIEVSDEDRAAVGSVDAARYAVFHAWPSGVKAHLKEWPTEHWIRLAEAIEGLGMPVVLTGGKQDQLRSERLAGALNKVATVVDLAGQLTLRETAAVLEGAAVTISVNTGIMHIAACFDTPLVALCGPTDPARWGPLSGHARVPVPKSAGCWNLHLGFEYHEESAACMASIDPDEVAAQVEALL